MSADVPLSDVEGRNYVRLLNLLAVTQIAFLIATSLWLPPFSFPQVPLFSTFRQWPQFVELLAFVGSLAGTFFARTPADKITRRVRHGVCAVSFAVLFAFNQHRLQPWVYQLMILHAWLALANPRWRLTGWRWLTISIYVYSALSKVDYAFCVNHGPFLLEGFLKSLRFADAERPLSPTLSFVLSAAMPFTELLAAMFLCFPRTQRVGLYLSVAMHLFLIAALGPWGRNHSAGVLIWNAFFIAQNWLLFADGTHALFLLSPRPRFGGDGQGEKASAPISSNLYHPAGVTQKTTPDEGVVVQRETTVHPLSLTLSLGAGARGQEKHEIVARGLLTFALIAPLGEPFGLWDHWPSWAVYAARPEQVVVAIHEDDLDRIPDELRKYLQSPALLEPWHPFRLDRWSLDATRAPIYPQSRFHVGVALALAERCDLTTLRVTIFSAPNRWTGRRERKDYVGLDAIRELAGAYWCNALPRC